VAIFKALPLMTIPDKIPIERIEYYHTHYLGQTNDGRQFWAYATHIFVKTYLEMEINDDWLDFRHEYVILHTFDEDGNHLISDRFYCGTAKETTDKIIRDKLEEMVSELSVLEFKDIEVRPFQVIIDDTEYGLIPDQDKKYINLEPNSQISFGAPWDGSYST
jgi:formate hydrogenlyase regulatory protein HycA